MESAAPGHLDLARVSPANVFTLRLSIQESFLKVCAKAFLPIQCITKLLYPRHLSSDSSLNRTSVLDMTPARASSVSSPLTVSTTRTSTPPNSTDLSRPRLKQIAKLIRDELDLRVAREGPDVLRPDDVLNLHEIFVALRHAQSITVSDLRATGIHKAVQDIAGVATRWPSRLCDDCDRIIEIWSVKFGSFGEIHPFLYGRGGRLEGIASVHEQSREVCGRVHSSSLWLTPV